MKVKEFIHSRFSSVAAFYSQETSALKLSCSKNDKITAILGLLADPAQAGLAVLSTDRIVEGIITERDIVRYIATSKNITVNLKVKELMTEHPKTISLGGTCTEALKIMVEGKFRHLPVINENKFVGLINIIQAASGRLIATTNRNEEIFAALLEAGDEFPSVDIDTNLNDFLKTDTYQKANYVMVSENKKKIDFITRNELLRYKLRSMK